LGKTISLKTDPLLDENQNEIIDFVENNCQINQKVFVIHTQNWTITEAYTVNKVTIKRVLGSLKQTGNVMIFEPSSDISESFLDRRLDFQVMSDPDRHT
jgi:hypothetical protein